MTVPLPTSVMPPRTERRYVRPPVPLLFPEEEKVPEGSIHWQLLVLLWLSVRNALGDDAHVTCDHFLYWDPTNPKRCLAPDLAVRIGQPYVLLPSWKTWELGAPHVGVEIVSDWDKANSTTEEKLERYRQAGIAEVVRFDPDGKEPRLQLWDLIEGDLVERDLTDPEARRCDALGWYWCIVEDPKLNSTLRLARDREGKLLLPTPEEAALIVLADERAAKEAERAAKEAERAAKEAERAAKEAERAAKEAERIEKETERSAKEAALARVAELEAELARRR